MIELKGLTKIYKNGGRETVALQDVNLTIPKGKIVGVIGLSGAGKSTLVRTINMLERPTAGQVLLNGIDLATLAPAELRRVRQSIGMVFQHFNLLSSRTVAGNVAFPLEIAGFPKGQIKKRVAELLELVGLSDKAQQYPRTLSGGQKQRVGIARALAPSPEVLLCDEATSALDPQTTRSILQLLQDINHKLGITIVVITHEMAVVKEICHEVAVVSEGKIVEWGPVAEVFVHPKTRVAHELVETVAHWRLPVEVGQIPGVAARVTFLGPSVGEPIIWELAQKFGVQTNILAGQVDHLGSVPYGNLVMAISGDPVKVDQALDYLRQKNLAVEVLNP